LSAAVAVRTTRDRIIDAARIVLGAVASCPLEATDAAGSLVGGSLTEESIAGAAQLAARLARPMDNTDFSLHWRKRMVRDFVTYALREVRGDDVRELRRRVSRAALLA
jgi:CO/xanthine dehydrogenase FAD-binding subunit